MAGVAAAVLAAGLMLGMAGVPAASPAMAEASTTAASRAVRAVDTAGVLNEGTLDEIDRTLERLNARFGVEARLVVLPGLDGRTAPEAARAHATWSPNGEGLVMLAAMRERLVRIEASPALSQRIPDAVWRDLIERDMAPDLRGARHAAALRRGAAALHTVLGGAPDATITAAPAPSPAGDWTVLRDIVFMLTAAGLAWLVMQGPSRPPRVHGGGWRA